MKLGREHIPGTNLDHDELHRKLAEIDENLMRQESDEIEMIRALNRRKEIYEQLRPETKAGKALAAGSNRAQGRGKTRGKETKDVEDTARKPFSRRSARLVVRSRRAGRIG